MIKTKCLKLSAILTMLLIAGCNDFPPPEGELCKSTGLQSSELACHDPSLPEDRRAYFRHLEKNDTCTNAGQFQRMQFYCLGLRADLIKCNRDKQ